MIGWMYGWMIVLILIKFNNYSIHKIGIFTGPFSSDESTSILYMQVAALRSKTFKMLFPTAATVDVDDVVAADDAAAAAVVVLQALALGPVAARINSVLFFGFVLRKTRWTTPGPMLMPPPPPTIPRPPLPLPTPLTSDDNVDDEASAEGEADDVIDDEEDEDDEAETFEATELQKDWATPATILLPLGQPPPPPPPTTLNNLRLLLLLKLRFKLNDLFVLELLLFSRCWGSLERC